MSHYIELYLLSILICLTVSGCNENSNSNFSYGTDAIKKDETVSSIVDGEYKNEFGDYNDVITINGETLELKKGNSKEDKHYNFILIAKIGERVGDPHGTVLASQWAVESGWGRHQSGKYNFFGIKAVKGEPGTVRNTREETKSGKSYYIDAKFKDYPSLAAGIKDRADFMVRNSRYRKHGYFDAKTPAEAAWTLQNAGYATDGQYANMLIKIISGIKYNGKNLNPHRPIKFQVADISTHDSPTKGSQCNARGIC